MVFQPSDRSAARWNTHFRFALTTGLRFSAHSNENTTTQKGDISNELTMGTFLKSFDTEKFVVDICIKSRKISSIFEAWHPPVARLVCLVGYMGTRGNTSEIKACGVIAPSNCTS